MRDYDILYLSSDITNIQLKRMKREPILDALLFTYFLILNIVSPIDLTSYIPLKLIFKISTTTVLV